MVDLQLPPSEVKILSLYDSSGNFPRWSVLRRTICFALSRLFRRLYDPVPRQYHLDPVLVSSSSMVRINFCLFFYIVVLDFQMLLDLVRECVVGNWYF